MIGFGLAVLVYQVMAEYGARWWPTLLCCCVPVALAYFLGFYGVLAAALFTGAVYKAKD